VAFSLGWKFHLIGDFAYNYNSRIIKDNNTIKDVIAMMRKLSIVALLFLFITRVFAQDECPALVEEAIAATGEACTGVVRNQACYGNVSLTATFNPEAGEIQFEEAGDIANIVDLEGIALSGMDVTESTWGIAVMQVQANLPDTLPGQNVTMLLFGDVEVTNAGTLTGAILTATVNTGANVRRSPGPDGTIIGALIVGDSVQVTGRLEDSSWLQVQYRGSTGWVFAELLDVEGDVNTLQISEAGVVQFGPMQAFYFRSGIGDAACAEAPDSGVLLQTPEGAGRIVLNVNDATITLGSTAFLQADPGGDMIINLLEGGATVETEWDVEFVPAGSRVFVPLDDEGHTEAGDYTPEPYDYDEMLKLPLSLLPEEIDVAFPLDPEEIEVLRATPTPLPTATPTVTPTSSIAMEVWTVTQTVVRDTCAMFQNSSFGVTMVFNEVRTLTTLNWMGFNFPMFEDGIPYYGSYTDSSTGMSYNIALTFQGPTFFTADVDGSRPSGVTAGCAAYLRWDGRAP
jgi:uncharacterized protein YraI